MSFPWKKFSFQATFFGVLITLVPMTARADWITIKTVSTQGADVTTKIEMSVSNDAWKDVEGESVDAADTKVFIEKCDGTTRFKAMGRDSFGFFTRLKPDGVKYCELPQIVFDDYVPTAIGQVLSIKNLTDPNAWDTAFGGNQNANSLHYAKALQDALAKGDYGFVAIAASEVAASLRAADAPAAAYPFETLSMQSTVSGVLKAKGVDLQDYEIFEVPAGGQRLTLTPQAKTVLEEYQIEKLGLPAQSREIGKTGWTTMRSLEGGHEVKAMDWKLEKGDAAVFNSRAFAPPS